MTLSDLAAIGSFVSGVAVLVRGPSYQHSSAFKRACIGTESPKNADIIAESF